MNLEKVHFILQINGLPSLNNRITPLVVTNYYKIIINPYCYLFSIIVVKQTN
jgi:hypothetical protein